MLNKIQELAEKSRAKKVPNVTDGNGYFLHFLARLLRPKNVLEIGTANGISTLYLASGLAANGCGHITTIEPQEHMYLEAIEHGKLLSLDHIISYLHGTIQEHQDTLKDSYDLIFIDGMKKEYATYLEIALSKSTSNSLIICDDVIKWAGKMNEFFDLVHQRDLEHIIVPTDQDDGVMLILPSTSPIIELCSYYRSST